MPRRLLLALIVLVAAPLVLLGWVSAAAMRQQQLAATEQMRGLLLDRLKEVDRNSAKVFIDYQRRIARELSDAGNMIAQLRQIQLHDPVARQGIFVSDDGLLLYPPPPATDDPETIALYAAISSMIGGRPDLLEGNDAASGSKADTEGSIDPPAMSLQADGQTVMVANAAQAPTPRILDRSLWQVWYMDQGAQLILWFGRQDGTTAGVLLERSRWMSDLTAALPDSKSNQAPSGLLGYTALVDESQQLVYRWGNAAQVATPPQASLALSSPLSTWQLQYYSDQPLIPQAGVFPIVLSLSGVGVVLLALGGYVVTSVQRQMKTARDRVTFAGQVSHELRTPLTNIRLYAELAESDASQLPADPAVESIKRRLGVIDTESRRLGRLVSGVLEMIRDDIRERPPQLSLVNPDEVIAQTLEQFAPSFANAKISVHRNAQAGELIHVDADILEMVLVNLLSNVEKYAAAGGYVEVDSRIDANVLIVKVSDKGNGIPGRHRRNIFRPFFRSDDSVNAPSGTGIGLTIALRAAQRHGGKLRLLPSGQGACFELRIPIEREHNSE
jgi:signal transduction histidine kinase